MQEAPDQDIDLGKIFAIIKRRWLLLTLGLLVGASIGIASVATTTPLYTATTTISLDTQEAENTRENAGLRSTSLDEEQIATEMEIMRSEAIAEKVVDALNLGENATFLKAPETGVSRIRGYLSGAVSAAVDLVSAGGSLPEISPSEVDQAASRRQAAVNRLRSDMSVSRVRNSRILTVRFTALSPTLAATVANGIAEIYIEDQLESSFDATERATDWLRGRAEELRQQSIRLDSAVERFRRENGLINVDGSIVSDTQLERLNNQVAAARADLVELIARRDRLDAIVERGDTSAAVSATASQSITTELRSRFLDTLNSYNSLVERLGEDHEQTRRLSVQLEQIQNLLFEEIKRSAEIAGNEVEVARERLENLRREQALAEEQVGADNEVMVELRELERNADTVRGLYTNFLQRYQQSLQDQNFQVSEARVLNPAKAPGSPSSPEVRRTILLFALLGLMTSGAYVGVREGFDDRLRTEGDIRDKIGMEYIGGLPTVSARKSLGAIFEKRSEPGDREVTFPEIMRVGADKPLSAYSEVLRAARMAITLRHMNDKHDCYVIGVASCFPAEGKTTTASNLANLLAKQGSKVMLIDGDFRNPGLTRGLKGDVEKGLVDILVDGAEWRDIYSSDPDLGTHVLPSRGTKVFHTSELLSGSAMETLIGELYAEYDYVIVDLPPLGPVIDARAVLPLIDGLLFVTKWGSTRKSHLQTILRSDPRLREKSYGVVMNMFDSKKARSYGSYGGAYYGYGYSRYYSDS